MPQLDFVNFLTIILFLSSFLIFSSIFFIFSIRGQSKSYRIYYYYFTNKKFLALLKESFGLINILIGSLMFFNFIKEWFSFFENSLQKENQQIIFIYEWLEKEFFTYTVKK